MAWVLLERDSSERPREEIGPSPRARPALTTRRELSMKPIKERKLGLVTTGLAVLAAVGFSIAACAVESTPTPGPTTQGGDPTGVAQAKVFTSSSGLQVRLSAVPDVIEGCGIKSDEDRAAVDEFMRSVYGTEVPPDTSRPLPPGYGRMLAEVGHSRIGVVLPGLEPVGATHRDKLTNCHCSSGSGSGTCTLDSTFGYYSCTANSGCSGCTATTAGSGS
jgi:hypothetical protein